MQDLHAQYAAQLFAVPLAVVTPEQRQRAKADLLSVALADGSLPLAALRDASTVEDIATLWPELHAKIRNRREAQLGRS